MENNLLLPEAVLSAYPKIKESWAAVGWVLLIMLALAIVVIPISSSIGYATGQRKLWILSGVSEVALLLTMLWLRRRSGPARWPGLILQELPTQWQLYALLPVLVPAHILLLMLVSLLHLPNWSTGTFHEIAKYPVLMVVTGCVLAPMLEEALFRGILLKGLLRNYSPAVAIGQSAFLFGLIHLNPAQSAAAMLTGLLLGWLYYRTRSLALCISFHAINNLLAFSYLHVKGSQSQSNIPSFTSWHQYWIVLAIAGVVLCTILWWVQRITTPASASIE